MDGPFIRQTTKKKDVEKIPIILRLKELFSLCDVGSTYLSVICDGGRLVELPRLPFIYIAIGVSRAAIFYLCEGE